MTRKQRPAPTRYASPDGRWRVELVTLDNAPAPNPEGEQGRQSAGNGTRWRVTDHGFFAGYADDLAGLRAILGDAFATLVPKEGGK